VKIFISWSGDRERAVAEALQAAIPKLCVADVSIFVSSQSISKGANGVAVIEANLDESAFGIVLVSRENQFAPWLNYEGGWLASTLSRPVATICLNLRPGDITSPLAPRQATQFENPADMATLLRQVVDLANPMMNDQAFETLLAPVWPQIRDSWSDGGGGSEPPARDSNEMLAEIVERVRRIEERELPSRGVNLHKSDGPRPKGANLRFERIVKSVLDEQTDGSIALLSATLNDSLARVVLLVPPIGATGSLEEVERALLGILPPSVRLSIEPIVANAGHFEPREEPSLDRDV
jgi:hypothetical protein